MTDIRRIGDSGVHTVEGNVAGNRAAKLTKQRDQQKAEYEAVKNKIKDDNSATIGKIDDKFNAASDVLEQEFRRKTVGLVTADDFRKAREATTENKADALKTQEAKEKKYQETKLQAREMKRKKIASSLSFEVDDEDEQDEEGVGSSSNNGGAMKKRLKDPTVDTSYLPDRERDREMNEKREQLQKEWLARQAEMKNEVSESHLVLQFML